MRNLLYLLLAFFTGFVGAGLYFHQQGSERIRDLDQRYTLQYGRAAETIGILEEQLGREREINRDLREHHSRARELTEGLAGTAERNVRNLQEAVILVGEIRKKLQILEGFYTYRDSGRGSL